MAILRFVNQTKDISVYSLPGSLSLYDDDDDVIFEEYGVSCPDIRNGIDKSGECLVEVEDQTNLSRSYETLIGLNSPLGIGDYTVYVNGNIVAYHALLTVSVVGDSIRIVKISWRGTILGG